MYLCFQTVSRSNGDDFEKEKLSEETIEVKNDMILFDPNRGSGTLTLPRRRPQEVSDRRGTEGGQGSDYHVKGRCMIYGELGIESG